MANKNLIHVTKDPYNSGKKCHYCKCDTNYVDSKVIYGRSFGMIYLCPKCKAYVGVHKGTDISLGRVSSPALRKAKKQAHFYFDLIFKSKLINTIYPKYIPNCSLREKTYIWLANELNIDRKECHIGYFTIKQCNKVAHICYNVLKQHKNQLDYNFT